MRYIAYMVLIALSVGCQSTSSNVTSGYSGAPQGGSRDGGSVGKFFSDSARQTISPDERAVDIARVGWESTRQEVHLNEEGKLVEWAAKTLWYQDEINGQRYMRRYAFAENRMIAVAQYSVVNLHEADGMDGILSAREKHDAITRNRMEALGKPQIVNSNPELAYEHYGWEGDSTFAIARVDKESGGAQIWYGVGELSNDLSYGGALRSRFREMTGEDLYGDEDQRAIPHGLKENPEMSPRERIVAIHDEVEGQTFYRDPSTGRGEANNELALFIMDKEGGEPRLMLQKTYSARDWLFINRINALVDGKRFEVGGIQDNVSRETTSIGIKETYVAEADGKLGKMVRAIARGRKVTIRLTGKNSHRDIKTSGAIRGRGL